MRSAGRADEERLQILLHGRYDDFGALGEGRAAVAVEAVLVGEDLHHDQAHAVGRGGDHLDVMNLGTGQGAGGFGGLRVSGHLARGQGAGSDET